MGEVYRAYDERLDRVVAVKAIRGEMVSDPQARRRFLDESRMASKIIHPYVATVFDVVEQDTMPYLVMEYIEGRRFDAVIADRPEPKKLARYALEISEGLAAIHREGLIHRDLKPGNIMVARKGHAKVMDFGLSGQTPMHEDSVGMAQTALPTVSTDQSLRGTLAYMSPEQLRVQELDRRTDLFSLGIVLYEAITGEHPFQRESLVETASAIINAEPGGGKVPAALREAGELGRIAMRLLEKDPDLRYQRARELVDDLERFLETPTGAQWPLLSKRNLVVLGLPAIALVSLAVLATWVSMRPEPATGSRPAVAVLPFEDRTGEPGAAVHTTMIADVLATQLSESRLLRSVPLHRVSEILRSFPPSASMTQRLEKVAGGVKADWLLAGNLYPKESGAYTCTVQVYRRSGVEAPESFTITATSMTGLARIAATRAEEVIVGSRRVDLSDDEARFVSSGSDEAQALFQEAKRLEREMRFASAIELLARAEMLDPKFIRASVLHADLLNRSGYEKRARAKVNRILREVQDFDLPEDSRMFLETAAMHATIHNQWADAADLYDALNRSYPDEPETLLNLAFSLERQAKFEASLGVMDQALLLDDLDPRIHLARARTLGKLERPVDAEVGLTEAERLFLLFEIEAGIGRVSMGRGSLAMAVGDFDRAESLFASATKNYLENDLPGPAMHATILGAGAELQAWKLRESEAKYLEALDLARDAGHFTEVINVLNHLGGLYIRERRLEEAEEVLTRSLEEAVRLENERLQLGPMNNLASVYNLTQRVAEARKQALDVIALAERRKDPRRVFLARLQLADADHRAGKLDEAQDTLTSLTSAAATGSRRAYAWQRLVDLHRDADRPDAALDAADRAVELTRELGDSARIGYSLALRARLHANVGAVERAAKDIREAESMLDSATPAPKLLDTLRVSKLELFAAEESWNAVVAGSDVDSVEASSEFAALMLQRTVGLLRTNNLGEAEQMARRVRDHRWASVTDRVNARLLICECLRRNGKTDALIREATRALSKAESVGMPLGTARAAAVLYSARVDATATDEMKDKAAAALRDFLLRVPDDRKQWVRNRWDVRQVLDDVGPPS